MNGEDGPPSHPRRSSPVRPRAVVGRAQQLGMWRAASKEQRAIPPAPQMKSFLSEIKGPPLLIQPRFDFGS